MHKIFGLFLFALTTATLTSPGHAATLPPPDHPLLEKGFQVPDHSAASDRLIAHIEDLAAKLAAMEQGREDQTLDGRLGDILLPDNPSAFRHRYSHELAVASANYKLDAWERLGAHYLQQNRLDDAKAIFFRIQQKTSQTKRKATAIASLAEAYISAGDKTTALNLYYLSLKTSYDRNARYRYDRLAEETDLQIKDIMVDADKAMPSACVVFSQELKTPLDASGYVTLNPQADVDVFAQGNRICIRGLKHGSSYEISVRAGVPSVAGPKLRHDTARRFSVPDMSERISFASDAYVLPKSSDETIPIKTVNLEEIELALYRIHDRNLVNAIFAGTLNRGLNQGDENDINATTGEKIWSGTMPVVSDKNREVVTNVPLTEMIERDAPGIYALVAHKADGKAARYWQQKATQWVLISDFGLTSFASSQGLDIAVRSLETTKPLAGVELTLVAKNNKILGLAKSNSKGMVHFAPGLTRGEGGNQPALVSANRKTDYNFLKLTGPSLDLSERGIAGRSQATELDAYLYTERGVYRPGEAVHVSALLRDRKAMAAPSLPLTFIVTRPDGTEQNRTDVTGDELGGYHFEVAISGAARAGRWSISAVLDDETSPVGRTGFQVEDFVPQRIKATLSSSQIIASPGDKIEATLQGNFLYGPPTVGLKGEVEIRIEKDPAPFEKFKSYSFGSVQDEFYGQDLPIQSFVTDQDGKATISANLTNIPDTSQPLRLTMLASLFDVSGRPVYAAWAVPLRSRAIELGLRRNKEASFAENEEAAFDVIALDALGNPVKARNVSYEWVREYYDYSWYQSGGRWQTRTTTYDETLDTGEAATAQDGTVKIARNMDAGRYRLDIHDKEGTSIASQRFYVGWWSSSDTPNVPDELELTLKSDEVITGEKLTAFIKAPFAGTAFISVLGDGLLHSRTVDLPIEGIDISIKVGRDWGPGAYLMVSAYRPKASKPSKLPIRAMGLKWFSIDKAKRQVAVDIDVPDTVLPRQSVTLPVTVSGEGLAGQTLKMTIAAVDEGILQLTNFPSPDPAEHYLSQRTLGIGIRDIYGRLIAPEDGRRGVLRSGGDRMMRAEMAMADKASEENAQGTTTRTVKTVALYTRDITLDGSGKGQVSLDLPDFNGRLRLMAVAYGATVMGRGDQGLVVRDPVVADLLLPRFLAPSDRAESSLSLHNLSGEDKVFDVAIETSGGVRVVGDATRQVSLANDQRFEVVVPLVATDIGDAHISLTVTAQGLAPITRDWDIAVRPAQPFVTTRSVSYLQTGESVAGEGLFTGQLPGTAAANVTLSVRPEFNVPDLLDALDRYPYGCTEQTVSRALPLLYLGDLARQWDKGIDDLSLARRIDHAIAKTLDRQRYDGSFSAWSSSGERQIWLSAYAFDFLTRAQEKGYLVPEAAYNHAREWLKSSVANPRKGEGYAQAYAFYVLARIGEVRASDVRYYAETQAGSIRTRLGVGHLAAALAILGERKLAEQLFIKAIDRRRPIHTYIPDYGSDMRDGATVLFLLAETLPNPMRSQKLSEALEKQFIERKYMSTQEQAWLLLATHALSTAEGAELLVSLNGEIKGPQKQSIRLRAEQSSQIDNFNVENLGASPIRFIQALRGVPVQSLPDASNGFEIRRTYYTTSGQLVDVANVHQNDLMVVLIEGRATTKTDHEALVVDLLPSGFEIENAAIGAQGNTSEFKFLPKLNRPQFQAARDDRFVAAINVFGGSRDFAVAYLVRAVTPGEFVHPAPFIEDMYKPEYHARGSLGHVSVKK